MYQLLLGALVRAIFNRFFFCRKMKDFVESAENVDVASDAESENENETIFVSEAKNPDEKWDCESILCKY